MRRSVIISVLLFFAIVVAGFLLTRNTTAPQTNTSRVPSGTQSVSTVQASPTSILTLTPVATGEAQQVKIYLVALEDNGQTGTKIGCGDSLVAVTREIAPTKSVLQAALRELLSLKDRNYGQSGLYNALYQSNLKVDSAEITNGVATVRLTGQVQLGGVCDNPRFDQQLRQTVLQFPTIKSAKIFINGKPLEDIVSEK